MKQTAKRTRDLRVETRRRAPQLLIWTCMLGAVVLACSSADDGASFDSDGGTPGIPDRDDNIGDGDGNGSVATGGTFMGMGGADNLPEETEDQDAYQVPVATGKYLWSANPQSGRVALIDVSDLSVRVLSAGLAPTYLTAVPTDNDNDDEATALVLNVGSSDTTRFSVRGDQVAVDTVSTHTGANRWVVSAKWAVAYSAEDRGQRLDPTEGLQEITIISLADNMKSTRLTVGYRPSQLALWDDEEHLSVVSEEGITIIELGEEPVATDWLDLGRDAQRRDVSLSDDGRYALVRHADQAIMRVIDLRDPDEVVEVGFSGLITDLDLSPGGRGAAVIRSKNELSTFQLADVLKDPSDYDTIKIENELFGSVVLTENGRTAILYTNAVEHEFLNIVNLRPGDDYMSHRKVDTQGAVYSVTPSPDGQHAIVFAGTATGQRSDAFSVVALTSERFPRVVGAKAPVSEVALGNDFGLVTASSAAGVHEAYLIELPSLSVSATALGTKPLSAGVLPDQGMAFVAQAHPEGRVTFFDLDAEQARTLTGFELSAEVVDR